MLNYYFKFDAINYSKCLEPTMSCKKAAIKAHSIQNSRILENLINNGHVYKITHKLNKNSFPNVEFDFIGRNEATTFTGLCAYHDQILFKVIDNNEIDLNNSEHLFLLAYRSIYKGLHANMDGAFKTQMAYLKHVDLGIDSGKENSYACNLATSKLLGSHNLFFYKVKFDQIYFNNSFESVCHDSFIINHKKPTIAVSSLFAVDNFVNNDNDLRVVLNVLPISKTETYVIFSYHKEDTAMARAALNRIINSTGVSQLYELSRLILNNCENFVLSPESVNNWTEQKKETILNYFKNTILEGDLEFESPHLYLF